MATAYTMFLKQAIREQRIPFEIKRNLPNKDTISAIKEVEELKNNPDKKIYANFGELLKEE